MPDLQNAGNVTLKTGVLNRDSQMFEWFAPGTMNSVDRMDVTISLLDQTGSELMIWRLRDAYPLEVTGADLQTSRAEVTVETIVLAHEGLTIENR